jgi:hypothetical protein
MSRELKTIDSSQISVVIQGPLYRQLSPSRGIEACIGSIRAHLPQAEIVVSTWQDENCEGIAAELIVTPPDPGVLFDFNGNRHNTNRQAVSTLAGINAATRPYILKLRSDHILSGSNMAIIGSYDNSVPQSSRLLKTPITVTTLFIRNPLKVPLLFHLSDLVQFGTREDMRSFWDQELKHQDDVFAKVPYKNPIGNFVGYSAMRMTPEQCLMLGFMRKKGYSISLQHPGEISPELVKLSEKLLSENFTVLDWERCDIDFPERFRKTGYSLKTLYRAHELTEAAALNEEGSKRRYQRIWLNKYVLNYGRVAWWIALATIVLTFVSPDLAKKARQIMRKVRGLEHPNLDRI